MDKWFKSKWFVRIISLAFAILLFVFVNVEANSPKTDSRFTPGSSDQVETVDDVPLNIKMDEERYVVSGAPEHVSVTLEGANSKLTPTVRQRNFKAYVDLEGLSEGEHEVEVQIENVPNGLSVYIEPKSIEVTIEEQKSKEFDVNVDFINKEQLDDGYEIGEPSVDPGTITIISSKSVIDQIAMVKVFVDVAGLTDDIQKREVPVNVYDNQGNVLNVNVQPETVTVSAELLNPSKTVAVKVPTKGKTPQGYHITSLAAATDEVTIYGTTSMLQDITEVSTNELDLSKIKESGSIETMLNLPDGIKVDDNKVEVNIKVEKTDEEPQTDAETVSADEETDSEEAEEIKIADKTLEDIPITINGVEEGEDVSLLQPSDAVVDVTVKGDEEDIKDVSPEDIRAVAIVSDLDEGEHQIPLTIDGPDQLDVTGSLNEVTVEVILPADE